MGHQTFGRKSSKKIPRTPNAVESLESRVLLAGQIFVGTNSGGTIAEYDTSGNPINAALVTGLTQNTYTYFAVSGSDLFVSNFYNGTVGEYTTAGVPINTQLITTGVTPFGITVSGNQLFVCNGDGGGLGTSGTVGEYTLGATPGTITTSNPTLITGLADPGGVTVSGSDLFVEDYATGLVGEYLTDGTPVNTSLVSGLAHPQAIVISGSDLFVTSSDDNTIGEFTTAGATVNASLVSGLSGPVGLAISGNDLFVDNAGSGVVGEYDTSGATVNASLVTGLTGTIDLAVTPSVAGAASQLAFATQPVATTTGSTLTPITVEVDDSDGDLVTTDNSNVTLALSTGTLGGTTTVAAVNGVATFSDLSITTAGTYTFSATDGSNAPAISTAFNINAPAVIKKIGALDPTFGAAGLAGHSIGFPITEGIQQDGGQSVLIGTDGVSPSEDFGVTRYNLDGSVDTTFGTSGVATTSFNGTDDVPTSSVILAGGHVLEGGTATTYTNGVASGSEFALAEFNPDGSLDTSFGSGTGQVLLSFSTTGTLSDDVLKSLVVSSTGIIYAGGYSNAAGLGTDFAVAAFNAAGLPDTAFNGTGRETVDFSGGNDGINSLALQTNGSIVAAGFAGFGSATSVALARFLPTGALDKHFGIKGVVTTNVRGVFDDASSVAIGPRGQIVVGGLSATGSGSSLSSDFLVARYTSTGKLDRTFASGTVVTSFGQPTAITRVLVTSTGQIIASGKTTATLTSVVNSQLDVAVARYTATGALDTSFNTTGTAVFSLNDDLSGSSVHVSTLELVTASNLGSEFDQFVQSNQGAVSITPGGALLVAGTSGSDTVEAEIITAGVDLVTSLLTAPPAAVIAGAKGTASVAIAEAGTSIATGTVTIELEVATDTEGDGAVMIKTLPERINLRETRSHAFKIAFAFPSALSAGEYFLLADVNNGTSASLQDLNTSNNVATSASTVNIAPPFVSLVETTVTGAAPFTPGKVAHVILTLTNEGNIATKGATTAGFSLSSDQNVADSIAGGTARFAPGLAAGKTRVYHLSFALASDIAAGNYFLIAVTDPTDNLAVTDRSSSNPDVSVSVTVR